MQVVKNILISFFALYLGFLLFMPKEKFYYLLEKELLKHDVKLNEAEIKSSFLGLEIRDISGYVKGIHLVSIDEIKFSTTLFFSKMEITNIEVDASLAKMLPQPIESVHINHSVLSALFVNVGAKGIFGELTGEINLLERNVHVDINDTSKVPMLKPWLTKGEKGWFYEKSF